MPVRLRHITTRRSGAKAVREESIESARLRIGRATGSDVQLAGLTVALEHAVIERREGRSWIEAVGNAELRVNGYVVAARVLAPDDVVRIGRHEIRVRAAEADEDLILEIEGLAPEAAVADGLGARSRLRIRDKFPTTRSVAWLTALSVLSLGVAAPLVLGVVAKDDDRARASDGARAIAPGDSALDAKGAARDGRAATALRALRAAWNPGPVSAGHAQIAESCGTCHLETFSKVPDRACLECHPAAAAHMSPATGVGVFDAARCGSCHTEHRGPHGLLAFSDDFCVRCHADLASVLPDTKLDDAGDFATNHPQFRVSVVAQPGSELRERIELSSAVAERSGLSFPHSKHLVPRLRAPGGETRLQCADCHALDARRATMEPISFRDHCQRCHSLTFDELHPERQAPHDEAAIVRQSVLEFYATLALTGQARDPRAPAVARRRPGREMTEPERLEALRWAEERTDTATRALLGSAGPCDECHTIASNEAGQPSSVGPSTGDGGHGSGAVGYLIAPVHLVPFENAARWLPLAKFSHDAHGAVQCERCHAAREAVTSEVVMLPGIAVCRDCHAGERATHGRVASPCLLCHDFHHAELGPLRPQLQNAAASAASPTDAK